MSDQQPTQAEVIAELVAACEAACSSITEFREAIWFGDVDDEGYMRRILKRSRKTIQRLDAAIALAKPATLSALEQPNQTDAK